MNYPTLYEVETTDRQKICQWFRFLPSPKNETEIEVNNRIVERLEELGGFTSEISKQMGLIFYD